MLKPGGRIVYSTCSFNPVENEAVVATVLRRFPGSLRLLNVDDQLPDLKRRPGLCTWKLMTKAGEIFDTYDQMPDNLRRGLPPTLFTPERNTELELGRCIRVLPHHQNTGGFFIAVFEKSGGVEPLAPEQLNVEPTATEAEVSVNPQQAGAVFKSINGEAPFIFLKNDSPATVGIREQFDLTGFPVDQLLVRSDSLKSSIYFVSESIKRILECPDNARLTVVNTGVKAFGTHEFSRQPPEENKMNNNSLPPLTEISASVAAQSDKVNTHRVHQEILSFILPHLPVDKIVDITMKDLELCIRESYPFFNQFSDEVCKRLEQARYGGMVLRCKVNGMLLAVWRAKKSVNLLLNKQEKQCLLNRLRIFGLIGERKEEIIGEQPSVETHF
jgi:hypothetical protein